MRHLRCWRGYLAIVCLSAASGLLVGMLATDKAEGIHWTPDRCTTVATIENPIECHDWGGDDSERHEGGNAMTRFIRFDCPECGEPHYVGYMEATLWDPGCLDGDPPEECVECGADMTGCDEEWDSGPERDPDDYVEQEYYEEGWAE